MKQPVLLVNTNVAKPPVSPVGLEYVGEALVNAGVQVRTLDLSFENDWRTALEREFGVEEPLIAAITVRNTDDCSFISRKSFLPWISDVVYQVKRLSQAYVLLGGVGFSVMPEPILELTGADVGIAGDGEETAVSLVRHLINGDDISDLPNLVHWEGDKVIANSRKYVDLLHLPSACRKLFDNPKYERLGAMVGIETKRGCSQGCIFCADPVAKGKTVRLRSPHAVVEEFKSLLTQGLSWFHLCDSEFNLPIHHAKEVCQEIINACLGDRLRWYCYCSPTPFDKELAHLMKRAGCYGINFGVDSLCDEQLLRLGRSHSSSDVKRLSLMLKQEPLNYMFDLLVGGPGETEETIRLSIETAKDLGVPLTGIAAGVRVYPGTLLGKSIASDFCREGLHPDGALALHEPVFFLSPYLDSNVAVLIDDLVSGDQRFLFLGSPGGEQNYNYADDEALCNLIREGARGAYWDIISRSR
jgi:hypothetical protein